MIWNLKDRATAWCGLVIFAAVMAWLMLRALMTGDFMNLFFAKGVRLVRSANGCDVWIGDKNDDRH